MIHYASHLHLGLDLVASFLCLAATTGGALRLPPAPPILPPAPVLDPVLVAGVEGLPSLLTLGDADLVLLPPELAGLAPMGDGDLARL